jgi:hypothetical protein
VRLASSDPRAPARIDPNYLAEPADLDVLMRGVALARDIGAAALAEWRAREVYPGPAGSSQADREDFVRGRATPSTIRSAPAASGRLSMRNCG